MFLSTTAHAAITTAAAAATAPGSTAGAAASAAETECSVRAYGVSVTACASAMKSFNVATAVSVASKQSFASSSTTAAGSAAEHHGRRGGRREEKSARPGARSSVRICQAGRARDAEMAPPVQLRLS